MSCVGSAILLFIFLLFHILALLCPVSLGSVQFNFEIGPYKCCFDYAKPISELKYLSCWIYPQHLCNAVFFSFPFWTKLMYLW